MISTEIRSSLHISSKIIEVNKGEATKRARLLLCDIDGRYVFFVAAARGRARPRSTNDVGQFRISIVRRGTRSVCARVRCAAADSNDDGGAGSGGAAVAGERRAGLFVVQLGRLSAVSPPVRTACACALIARESL